MDVSDPEMPCHILMLWQGGGWHMSHKPGPGPFDRGFMLGDGLFETMLWYDKGVHRLEDHHKRFAHSAHALGFPPPPSTDKLADCARQLAARKAITGQAALRVTLSRGAGGRGLDPPDNTCACLVMTLDGVQKQTGPLTLATVSVRRNPWSITAHHKTLSYLDNIMARQQARQKGAGEALMLNTQGNLACAAAANLFWLDGHDLYTPALDEGVLPGIIRCAVLQASPALGLTIYEGAWLPSDIVGADCVFLTNSLMGLRAVHSLDGVRLACDHTVLDALRKNSFLPIVKGE